MIGNHVELAALNHMAKMTYRQVYRQQLAIESRVTLLRRPKPGREEGNGLPVPADLLFQKGANGDSASVATYTEWSG